MKRFHIIISLAFFLLAISPAANAQLRYGFRFGADIAKARLSKAEGFDMDNSGGFTGGLVFEYQLQSCGLAPELAILYTRYNTRLKEYGKKSKAFGRDFIEIPVHLKYKFWMKSLNSLLGPMIYTGPSFAFRVNGTSAESLTSKRFQPGWDIGVGLDVVNFLQISAGYRFGFGNAIDSWGLNPDATLRTNAWDISATLLFDF